MKVTTVLLLLLGIGYTFADTCSVDPDDRTDCGWYGIDEETCEGRNCCWDEDYAYALWCFYPTDNKCYGIKPEEREDCGYFGIQRYECEVENDCCWVESTVPNVPWCFEGKLPKKAPPTAPSNETTVEPTEVSSNGTTAAPTTASSNQTAAALAEDEQAFEEALTA